MTPADIVAEATEKAKAESPNLVVLYVSVGELRVLASGSYRSADDTHVCIRVHDDALAHVAERCAKAEARGDALEARSGLMEAVSMNRLELLEKAEERAKKLRAALDAVMRLSHDNEGAWEAARDALAEDAGEAVGRG